MPIYRKLNCKSGNVQCGNKCQRRYFSCFSNKSGEVAEALNRYVKLVAPLNMDLLQKNGLAADELVELPEVYDERLRSFAKKLQIAVASNGLKLSKKEIDAKAKFLEKFIAKNDEKVVEQFLQATLALMNLTGERQLSSTLEAAEVEVLQRPAIKKKLLDGYEDPTKLIGGRYEAVGGKKIPEFKPFKDQSGAVIKYPDEKMPLLEDDDFIRFFIAMAPQKFRNTLSRSGKPAGKAFAGYDADGNRMNSGNGSNDARRIVLARQWIRQRNQSAYTGLPLGFANADLEHIKPLGKNGNDAEDPNNFVWISVGENQTKNEYDMSYLFDGGGEKAAGSEAFPGVDNIADLDAWQERYKAAEEKAAARKEKGDELKEKSAEIFEQVQAGYEAKAMLIEIYKKEKMLDKVLKIIGEEILDKVEGEGEDKKNLPPSFRREAYWIKERDGSKIIRERNGPKKIAEKTGDFDFGKIKTGKMSIAEWLLWNFTELPKSNQLDLMRIYEDVLKAWENTPERQAPAAITQMLIDAFRKYYEEKGL